MVVNIRGTSGSGKSTLIRNIMALYGKPEPQFLEKRKQPIAYICRRKPEDSSRRDKHLAIIGHYETACGGCDTIPRVDLAYNKVVHYALAGFDVLYEGLLLQSDWKRLPHFRKDLDIRALFLTTPIEVCLASVQLRRDARGDHRELDPANTLGKYKVLKQQPDLLRAAGVPVEELSRFDALRYLMRELGFGEVSAAN
jgi:hypothetical protein